MDAEAVLYTPVLDQNKRGAADKASSESGMCRLVYVRRLIYREKRHAATKLVSTKALV